jgi:hypothetical protein
MVALSIDSRQVHRLTRSVGLLKDGIPRVLAPAINRALDKGRTEVRREIRKIYVIKLKDIPIKVNGASRTRLTGAVVLKDRMLPLGKFEVTPKGVQRGSRQRILFARVKKGGGGKLPGAFNVATGGYIGPFIRRGAARLPIKRLLTISAPIMASQPTVGPVVNKAMGDTLAKRIDHEIKRVMASAGGK